MRSAAVALLLLLAAAHVAAEDVPRQPRGHVDDRAGWLPPAAASELERRLSGFQERTGHEIVLSIFPELPSASLEDFTVRTAQAWRIGSAAKDDGLVLFVFVKDRKTRIEVGYGLEGQVPDVVAKRVLDDVIAPRLRAGDPAGGMKAGVEALIAAIEGRARPGAGAAATPGDDVPEPLQEDLNDLAGLLNPEAAQRVREALGRAREATGCRTLVTLYPEPPSHYTSTYTDSDQFTFRSMFRLYPMEEGESQEAHFERIYEKDTAMLHVFGVGEAVQSGYMGLGACAREDPGRLIVHLALVPRFGTDPAGALEDAVATLVDAVQGRWTPPPPPTPPAPPPLTGAEKVLVEVVGFAPGGFPVGMGLAAFSFFAALAFPFALYRSLRRGENFWWAWLKAIAWIVVQLLSSRSGGGTTYSSGGGSSSSSGGGGSFGGGGASGSW